MPTLVKVHMPECNILQYSDQKSIELWKKWCGKYILIGTVLEAEKVMITPPPCNTDVGFKIVDPVFLKEYGYSHVYICRHMIEAGD